MKSTQYRCKNFSDCKSYVAEESLAPWEAALIDETSSVLLSYQPTCNICKVKEMRRERQEEISKGYAKLETFI